MLIGNENNGAVRVAAVGKLAEASKEALATSGRFTDPIVTSIEDAKPFYDAEEEHQQFYKKNPLREYMMMMPRKAYQKKYWSDRT